MEEIILCKLGEMVLKGLNRRNFEERLLKIMRHRVRRFGEFRVYSKQSTIYVEPKNDQCDMDGAFEALRLVFGIVGLSRAKACPKEKDAFVACAKEYLADALSTAHTFKVESKRSDKSFPMTSIELSQYVGGELQEAFPNLQVDVHHPELTVHLEVRDLAGYVHAAPVPGAGGLPVGINGKAAALLSGGIDSPVACYMIAKRGINLELIHFFSYPYTSLEAKDKVIQLAKELTGYCGKMKVHVIPFTQIQEEIRRNCPDVLFTLIMRRFMMRLSEAVAVKTGCKALVTGECLGQVASQTLEAMNVTGAVVSMPVLRPVIGMDKEEIIRVARKIGTFETSILPYEDCCTVFTPKHPRTRPKVAEVEAAESVLDIDALVEEALQGIERIELSHE
jgi:thiamine biosynthesis protein ThiI